LDRRVPPLQSAGDQRPLISLGQLRSILGFATGATIATLAMVPIGSLIVRLGESGSPPHWSPMSAFAVLQKTIRVHGLGVLASAALAASVGVVAATLALVAAWLSRESNWFRNWIWVAAAVSWAAAGPVIGFGLKQTILFLMSLEDRWSGTAMRAALHSTSSMLPVFWAALVRLWPFGLALIWQPVRSVPPFLVEAARIDGASPGQELRHAVWPATRTAWCRSAVAVAVLALGEVSASKIVATPGGETLAHNVFTQMHSGVTTTLSAQCLLLFVLVAAAVVAARPCRSK
jgi:iron(III) transport system permease protein